MDISAIPTLLPAMVPFIDTVGLRIDAVGPGTATATLPARRAVNNHMGTAHAGAVYTLGESASGAVVLGLLGDQLPGIFIALKSAAVTHLKARPGDVEARAMLVGEPAAVRSSYEATGKVDFDVAVSLLVEGVETARVVYTWAARAPRPASSR